MAFDKKQSKNVKKFHYLERLWLFMNEDDGCGGIWYWRWQGVNYVNQMRAQWASVPYILLKKDSRRAENLVLFDLDRGNSQRSENSVHYSGLCGSVLEVAVDKIEDFCSVFVYFEGARTDFGGYGRQNFGISLVLCLLRRLCGAFLKASVDKIQAFITIFVYFEGRASRFRRWR